MHGIRHASELCLGTARRGQTTSGMERCRKEAEKLGIIKSSGWDHSLKIVVVGEKEDTQSGDNSR